MSTKSIFNEIVAERARQMDKWDDAHDDGLDWQEWAALFDQRIEKVNKWHDTRKQVIILAALAVAAIEAHDRKANL